MYDLTQKSKEEIQYEKKAQELKLAKAKINAAKRKEETHKKCIIGGVMHKYFPEAFVYEQEEWEYIISETVKTPQFQDIIEVVKNANEESKKKTQTKSKPKEKEKEIVWHQVTSEELAQREQEKAGSEPENEVRYLP